MTNFHKKSSWLGLVKGPLNNIFLFIKLKFKILLKEIELNITYINHFLIIYNFILRLNKLK